MKRATGGLACGGGWVVAVVSAAATALAWGGAARACLREHLDDRAVQWSTTVVRAKLVDVSERVEVKAVSVKSPKGPDGKRGPDVTAVYWYRLYSFEVIESLDGPAKPKHRIEAIRFFGRVDDPGSRAAATAAGARPVATPPQGVAAAPSCALTKSGIGKTFVLFLRPEQDVRMAKPPVWNDTKGDLREKEVHDVKGMAVVHMMPDDRANVPAIRGLIAATRSAERKAADAELKKRVEQVVTGSDAKEIESAAAALRAAGFKAVGPLKSARDATVEREEIIAGLVAELSPPYLALEMGNVAE